MEESLKCEYMKAEFRKRRFYRTLKSLSATHTYLCIKLYLHYETKPYQLHVGIPTVVRTLASCPSVGLHGDNFSTDPLQPINHLFFTGWVA
jgi:hypothetical protein